MPAALRPRALTALLLALVTSATAAVVVPATADAAASVTARVTANPGDPTDPVSTRHRVVVGGVRVPVRTADIDGTTHDVAMVSMTSGRASALVTTVGLSSKRAVTVSPKALGIRTTRSGATVRFELTGPHALVVQAPGTPELFLFVTPAETDVPDASRPDVIAFGPGVHDAGVIEPTSGQTVYLAPGALVRGRIEGDGVTGVRVMGRGLLDGSTTTSRADRTSVIEFRHSADITVEGIGIRGAQWWQTLYLDTHDVRVSWTNLMGRLINNDGIDLDGVQDVSITHNFVMSGDDGFGWHALDAGTNGELETRDVRADDTTFWNVGGGYPIRIGSSLETTTWTDARISRSYVLRANYAAFGIDDADWAEVSNVLVDRMYIETRPLRGRTFTVQVGRNSYSNATGYRDERGSVRGLTFRTIRSVGNDPVVLRGADAAHTVSDVVFQDVQLGGRKLTRRDQVTTNASVGSVTFR